MFNKIYTYAKSRWYNNKGYIIIDHKNMVSSISKVKNSRKNFEKALIIPSLDFLLCSLYTLCGSHEIFKKLNLRTGLDLDIKNNFELKDKNLYQLENLISQAALKQFILYLLTPFLTLNDDLNDATKLLKRDSYQIALLEKYMRKFRRNYKRYFFYQDGNYGNLPTDKE